MERARHWGQELTRFAVTLLFVFFVGVATAGSGDPLLLAVMLSSSLATALIRALFPSSRLFPIAFGNLIAVYLAIFSLFVEEIYFAVSRWTLGIGFSLPVFSFVAGCWLRQGQIRSVVARPAIRDERRLVRASAWLAPVSLIGAAVLLLSQAGTTMESKDTAFLAPMFIIGVIVFAVSRDVAVFLVDAGLLFEEFFSRISRLLVPAFAFLSFYSVLVILFASAYRIMSQYMPNTHFYIGNTPHALSFPEAVYFSVITISTVGYGDIIPHSSLARVLASIEVICGFLLLLFGVSELLEYAREHRRSRGSRSED
jgi:voltage-gated potassium channel